MTGIRYASALPDSSCSVYTRVIFCFELLKIVIRLLRFGDSRCYAWFDVNKDPK